MSKKKFRTKQLKNQLEREIDISRMLYHQNIITCWDVFEDDHWIYVVFEKAKEDLEDSVKRNDRFSEKECRVMFREILSAIKYLHKNEIAHRDLKPENILVDENNSMKLGDFGLARSDSNMMHTFCGTLYFIAPEMLSEEREGYTTAVDMWSAGAILFFMLSGDLPFTGNQQSVLRKISEGNFSFDSNEIWEKISPECKNLISSLLDIDPVSRLTAEKALIHPWFEMEKKKNPKKRKIQNEIDHRPRKKKKLITTNM
eukprot:TRINITY_DN2995_c0_g2_i2.p1 TRINITY_DN2995_c0_g2~~TRINITY_DN2995_c0_g2_i2.p1  ORF type:complete len:257 (-),score=64.70 TRINITY_DN2995_c0_g2_i2:6-776(-)